MQQMTLANYEDVKRFLDDWDSHGPKDAFYYDDGDNLADFAGQVVDLTRLGTIFLSGSRTHIDHPYLADGRSFVEAFSLWWANQTEQAVTVCIGKDDLHALEEILRNAVGSGRLSLARVVTEKKETA